MLRVARWIVRRFAQQLFRNKARLVKFRLRPGRITLEHMNNALQQSLRCRRGRVGYKQGFTGELFHGGESFGKLALPSEKPPFPPSLHATWITLSWNRGNLFFSQAKV